MRRFMLAAALLVSAETAQAQSNLGPSNSSIQVHAFSPLGQSFTAVNSGLLSIGFAFKTFGTGNPVPPVTITLLSGDGLGGSTIAQKVINPVDAGFLNTTLSFADFTGTTLTVGAFYTATMSTPIPYWGVAVTSNLYAEGSGYFTDPIFGQSFGGDFLFQVNSATAVPEPASGALLVAGLGMLGVAARRRRSSVSA